MASPGLRTGASCVTLAAEPGVDKKEEGPSLPSLHNNAPGSPS
jgi:hypothetical protein